LKGEDNWSKSELVLAIVILAKFHSLCSVVLGCGIVPEPDMEGGYCEGEIEQEATTGNESIEDLDELADDTARLIERLQRRDSVQNPEIAKEKLFETLETQETFSNHRNDKQPPSGKESDSRDAKKARIEDKYSQYLGDNEVRHVDFDVKSIEYYVFRLQDYNWEEQGCSLVSKFLPEVGEMLDVEFNSILNLTDYSLFNSKEELETDKVDTWPFRQAVWYYVLRLAGMSHDDYNYHEVLFILRDSFYCELLG
jgi:sestrin